MARHDVPEVENVVLVVLPSASVLADLELTEFTWRPVGAGAIRGWHGR